MSLFDLTALQLGKALKAGEVTVREATQAALDSIAAREPECNS